MASRAQGRHYPFSRTACKYTLTLFKAGKWHQGSNVPGNKGPLTSSAWNNVEVGAEILLNVRLDSRDFG
jgi:hypothetical protein